MEKLILASSDQNEINQSLANSNQDTHLSQSTTEVRKITKTHILGQRCH